MEEKKVAEVVNTEEVVANNGIRHFFKCNRIKLAFLGIGIALMASGIRDILMRNSEYTKLNGISDDATSDEEATIINF